MGLPLFFNMRTKSMVEFLIRTAHDCQIDRAAVFSFFLLPIIIVAQNPTKSPL